MSLQFGVRNFSRPMNHHIPNTYRFFEIPITQARYTYIMDVDVMLLDNIVPHFEAHFPNTTSIINNIIRRHTKRLTGMHFVKTKEYYTPQLKALQNKYYASPSDNDECILYKLVEDVGQLPPIDFQWRPIFGIHFSPNRGQGKSMALKTTSAYKTQFKEVMRCYPAFMNYSNFKQMMNDLNNSFEIKAI